MNKSQSLARLITTQFGFKLDSEEFQDVFNASVRYIARAMSYSAFQEKLKPLCKNMSFSAKDFRLLLHSSEYLSLRIKIYVYRIAKTRELEKEDAMTYAFEYAIPSRDGARIYRMWIADRSFRSAVRPLVKNLKIKTHLDLDVLRTTMNLILKPVSKYVKFFTYKKLRFICKSQNRDLADMHSELTIKAMSAFYKMMPCTLETKHVENYLKRAVHNAGVNIISANTSLKAGRLVNNDPTNERRDAFTLLVVSENQMAVTSSDDGSPATYDSLSGTNPILALELSHSVNSVLEKHSGKKRKFLEVLLGRDSADFSSWLQRAGVARAGETNSDVQLRIPVDKFNRLASDWLNVAFEKVERFLQKLRGIFSPTDLAVA